MTDEDEAIVVLTTETATEIVEVDGGCTVVEQAVQAEVIEISVPDAPAEILEIAGDVDVVLMETGVTEILEAGTQGPPGRDGVSALEGFPFSFGDASPSSVGVFQGVVVAVSILILAPFDGVGAQLSITTPAATLLATNQNLPGEAGRYETSPGLRLNTPTVLSLNITPGIGASAGNGIVYLEIAS